jgi:hypothetical protein
MASSMERKRPAATAAERELLDLDEVDESDEAQARDAVLKGERSPDMILHEAREHARSIIQYNIRRVEKLANALMTYGSLTGPQVRWLLGAKSPREKPEPPPLPFRPTVLDYAPRHEAHPLARSAGPPLFDRRKPARGRVHKAWSHDLLASSYTQLHARPV